MEHQLETRRRDLSREYFATFGAVLVLLGHAPLAAAQTPLSPTGAIATPTPTFTWTASVEALYYSLWVDDSREDGKINLSLLQPGAVGCAGGTGVCSVSPGVMLAPGPAYWQLGVKTSAHDSWSGAMAFTVSSDAALPVVTITHPTTAPTYISATPTITLHGTASDNVGVTQVSWTNDRGGSGTATGTAAWSASLVLQAGSNLLAVSARDAANNRATDTLTVVYNPTSPTEPSVTAVPYPVGTITTLAPVFRWNATAGATSYSLWVDDAKEEGKIDWGVISPAAAGCPNGTGVCSVSPGIALAPGRASWVRGVQTSAAHSWGTWVDFIVPDPNAPCLSLYPESQRHPGDAQVGFIVVTTNGCAWTAIAGAPWIVITPGWTSGVGNGQVRYELLPNATGASREADIVVGPRSYHVTQLAGTACSATLSRYSDVYDAAPHVEAIGVSLSAGCPWTATSNVSWVVLRSDSRSGTGPGTVRWDVAANPSTSGRSGTLIVAGRTYAVEQSGAATGDPCAVTVTPLDVTLAPTASTYNVAVTTAAGCAWSATTANTFIDIISGSSGVGSGSVTYFIQDNPSVDARTAVLDVAARRVDITQSGVSGGTCRYSTSAGDPLSAGVTTGSITVTVSAGCSWTASSESDFVSITSGTSGSGSGVIRFTLSANSAHESRLGALTVAGQLVGVMQLGVGGEPSCVTAVTPGSISVPAIGAGGSVAVSAGPTCAWSVASGVPWATVSGDGVTRMGSGSFSYLTGVNGGPERAVSFLVGSQEVTIAQDGVTPTGNDGSDILWPGPQSTKANDCLGNCGKGCGTFLAVCGSNGGNWTSETLGGLQRIDDTLLEVCSGGQLVLGTFPRYTTVLRWTYHGVESPACLEHDSLCRSWAGRLPILGGLFCGATVIGPFSYTICEGARPWTWSYEEPAVGRARFPTAIVGNPSAPPCGP